MKKFVFTILVIVVILTLFLSGCKKNEPTAIPTLSGEALVLEKIKDQHMLDFVLKEKRTAEEWEQLFERHENYGCILSEEERASMIEWLVANQ